jgi:hypothetical protein
MHRDAIQKKLIINTTSIMLTNSIRNSSPWGASFKVQYMWNHMRVHMIMYKIYLVYAYGKIKRFMSMVGFKDLNFSYS